MAWVMMARMGDFQDDMLACEHNGEHVALFRVGETIHATSNVCTHDFALLTDGFFEDNCIECPLHAARFDVSTGEVQCGPARENLAVYPVEVRDEEIWVDL
ncbi:non-heme iron oxygenase ferredoxin subunit [uncultured Pigmentiphaga sp.]|jgi:Ferredoxin subunits of nitrite reductase and ring-hydroxylating dioxygenases|uniref:non-heme iron oxygenase ferredoxin subunit n=1 Tax=uncultured Pigmentiphaga sp. TaxID=340361 RepID=UPI0026037094|nr:non-heme iron oxygenase ferredoxin subunit [uncultured Pigmentiphaga sp.]